MVPTNLGTSGVGGNWTVGAGASLITALGLATTFNNNAIPSVVTPVFVAAAPAQVIVHGTTTVNFTNAVAGGVHDFGGNALAAASLTIP
jgi:hypothetical protein